MERQTTTRDRTMRRAVNVGLVAPAVLAGAALALQLALVDDITQEVVTHWGVQGADGYGPAWTYLSLTFAAGLGMPTLMTASALRALGRGERSPMLRLMPALALGLAALITVSSTGALMVQREGDGSEAIVSVMLVAFGASVIAGAVAWWVQPAQDVIVPAARPVRALETPAGARVVWLGRAEMGKGPMLAMVGACVLLVGLAVWMWVLGDLAAAVVVTAVAALVILLACAMTVFHVRADSTGLAVRSSAGVPRFTVPARDIAAAAVIDVAGLAQFGGWGVRVIPGATGIVLRNGSALEVTRTSGRRFVVTLDDAATVAGVLTAAAEGSRADQD